jgi:uncharacterized protein
MIIEIQNEIVHLMPEKVVFLAQHKILLAADLHFGKVNHFRRSGIAVPAKANDRNAAMLIDAINKAKPDRVIFLGDLFHSHYNEEWETVGQIRKHFSLCSFELVMGNHDILTLQQYKRNSVSVFLKELSVGQWVFTHEPMKVVPADQYNLAGHIHPGVRLQGTAKQSLTLPCFYFSGSQGILPAFGSFTGLAKIVPKEADGVFVIANGKVMRV